MSAEGRVIAGRYRLLERIGSGAMGVVWQAVDERLHRTVAVKLLLLQPGYTPEETEEARQRTMREGRIAARLQHQNAILVFDVAEDEGQPVLVMEFLPAQSLASVVGEHGVLPPLHVARIGVQVSGALAAAHMAGIVHRDLKPGNILLGENGQAKITDFGISRAIGDVAVTKSGILAGTPAYLAPEVATGRDPAPASDVFSLGSTLYSAVEGTPPFGVDENAIGLLHRVAQGNVEPPRQAGPLTPALLQMLRADPVERPTMAQARDLLQAVMDGRPIPNATPTAGWQRPAPAAAGGGGTRRAPSNTPAAAANPPTRVGGRPAQAAPQQQSTARRRDSGKALRIALWVAALLIAVLVGVLGANALGGSGTATGSDRPTGDNGPSPTASTKTQQGQPTDPTSTATAPSSAQSSSAQSSSAEETPDKDDVTDLVEDYYDTVESSPEDAWDMLGPALQKQGKDAYLEFWESVDEVELTDDPQVSGDTATVELTFTTKDGASSEETHELGITTDDDGEPVLNTDSVT